MENKINNESWKHQCQDKTCFRVVVEYQGQYKGHAWCLSLDSDLNEREDFKHWLQQWTANENDDESCKHKAQEKT